MPEIDFTRYGLAKRVYAAAHDMEPWEVDDTDGGYGDVCHIIGEWEGQGYTALAKVLGLPNVEEAEDWQIVEGIERLRWLHTEAAFERDRLHSWAGLMSLLDEHWPDAVFRGSSGDPGPTIVFLLRQIDRLREEVDHLRRMLATHRFDGEALSAREAIRDELINQLFETTSAHDRERSSRQAWAAEAERLQADLDEIMKPAIWDLPHAYRNSGSGEPGTPGDCRTCGRPDFDDLHETPEPPKITVCACITDEQASQLGPRFSRPVCAVHPEVK